jgi:hypothetical protein
VYAWLAHATGPQGRQDLALPSIRPQLLGLPVTPRHPERSEVEGSAVPLADILARMNILPGTNDSEIFIVQVDALTNGILGKHTPESLILIKVNSWFGSRWLRFSGKTLGALGVRRDNLSVPPFVPSRIVSQRRFAAPNYLEIAGGQPLHRKVRSGDAILRRIAAIEPGAAVLWYSGNSKITGHGSAMAYVPASDSYSCCYISWADGGAWHVEETIGISHQELSFLTDSAGRSISPS